MQKYPVAEKPDIAIMKRARMCGRKHRFDSFAQALVYIKNSDHAWKTWPRIYHCPHCDGFHFTASPRRAPRGNCGDA